MLFRVQSTLVYHTITRTFYEEFARMLCLTYTVKSVYNDHPWDSKILVVVDRWLLLKGNFSNEYSNWDFKMVVVVDRWSLFRDGR